MEKKTQLIVVQGQSSQYYSKLSKTRRKKQKIKQPEQSHQVNQNNSITKILDYALNKQKNLIKNVRQISSSLQLIQSSKSLRAFSLMSSNNICGVLKKSQSTQSLPEQGKPNFQKPYSNTIWTKKSDLSIPNGDQHKQILSINKVKNQQKPGNKKQTKIRILSNEQYYFQKEPNVKQDLQRSQELQKNKIQQKSEYNCLKNKKRVVQKLENKIASKKHEQKKKNKKNKQSNRQKIRDRISLHDSKSIAVILNTRISKRSNSVSLKNISSPASLKEINRRARKV